MTTIGHLTGVQGIDPERPSLVFIHGAGGSAQGWQGLLSALGRRWNTIALDLPGHGQTPGPGRETINDYADWLDQALAELAPGRVILIGHSMGGATAQTYALAHPDRLDGLVLIGTGAALPVNPKILQGIEAAFDKTTDAIIGWCFQVDDQALKQTSLDLMRQAGPETVHGDFAACAAFDLVDKLGRIDVPVLAVTGRDDKMTPPAMAELLALKLPRARAEIVDGAGHMVQVEKAREVIDLIDAFAAEVWSD